MSRFNSTIEHLPGKELYTADTLLRAPLNNQFSLEAITLENQAELCMLGTISHIPASNKALHKKSQSEDPMCWQIVEYCNKGWPRINQLKSVCKSDWKA